MIAPAGVELVQLSSIHPCPENDTLYGAQSMDDPDILALIESIRANGLLEPIMISVDNVIISGHRRRFCALHAGLLVGPVIRNTISYWDDREAFLRLLVDANEQRKKSAGMQLREVAMRIDPKEAVVLLLCVTDSDPAGEAIVQNFKDDLADDFGPR